jgi:hypothetical protein
MKSFSSHITELFDTSHPWSAMQTGGDHEIYRFAFAKMRGGKMIPCPIGSGGLDIEKFYRENGLEITGRDSNNIPLVNGKPTPLHGVVYEVGLHSLAHNPTLYTHMMEKSNLEKPDMSKVWELYFQRMDSFVKWSTNALPHRSGSRWYWSYDNTVGGGDEDLNIMSGGEAAKVFGTVLDITKAFAAKHNRKGILIGTKSTAKDVRGRIYSGMATRNAGQVIQIPYPPRDGMKQGNMIWFDKIKQFNPLANQAKV